MVPPGHFRGEAAILLREGWHEGERVRKRELANLTDWPAAKVDALRRLLKNEPSPLQTRTFELLRLLPVPGN